MTGLQAMIAAGTLVGLGLVLLVARFLPAEPDLAQALSRLSPAAARQASLSRSHVAAGRSGMRESLGGAGARVLPARVWGTVPAQDLAVLRISPARYYGDKLLFATLGLLAGPLLPLVPMLVWPGLPLYLPVGFSLAVGGLLWFLPTYNVRDDARTARLEFRRALGAYVDLVALERAAGSAPRQAMEAAAQIGDSWVFARLAEELARTRWSGTTPWDAMRQLGDELGLPELHELADIIRLSGDEGAQIYTQLRARSASMRAALLTAHKTQANKVSEAMTVPMTLLALIFLCLLAAPQALRVIEGG